MSRSSGARRPLGLVVWLTMLSASVICMWRLHSGARTPGLSQPLGAWSIWAHQVGATGVVFEALRYGAIALGSWLIATTCLATALRAGVGTLA